MNTNALSGWAGYVTGLIGVLIPLYMLLGCGDPDEYLPAGEEAGTTELVEMVAISEEAPPSTAPALGRSGEVSAFTGSDLDEIFSKVATGVRYEPYRGILRGAELTALAGSGNAADQSMLLAEALRAAGYQVRFVRGTLEGENVSVLLRGMYPARLPMVELEPGLDPYDPARDGDLRAIVEDHVWVEVFQGESWLPLDPAFPRAKVGEAYAVAREHFEEPLRDLYQRVRISIREESRENRNREVGVIEGTTVELGLRPITLVSRAVPQSTTGEAAQPTRSPGGLLGGALAGRQPEAEEEPSTTEPEVVGVRYRRYAHTNGQRSEIGSTLVLDAERSELIRREWLEITLTEPGTRPRVIERTLYPTGREAAAGGPPEQRTYAINVIPGPVPADWVDGQASAAAASVDIRSIQQRLDRLARASETQAADAALEVVALGEAAGTVVGHLIGLRFAAASDDLTRIVAQAHGLTPAWNRPRVLITSIETVEEQPDQFESTVSLDLRINEIATYPYPGVDRDTAILFQVARGLQDSALESEVIARATGLEQTVNVSPLMARAHADDVPVYVLTAADRSGMNQLQGLPAQCRDSIERALEEGRHVIVPERAIQLAGAERWGWWELDPLTGHMISVMEGGEHQAMAEYKFSLERIGLNDESGFVIGAMIGATATLVIISALMLEYGATTPDMIRAVEDHLEQFLCNACFAGAAASETAQISVSANIGCKEWSKKLVGGTVGASASISFCDEYRKGFECASGLLMAGLRGEATPIIDGGVSISGTGGTSASFNCSNVSGPQSASAGVTIQDGIVIKP